MGLAILEITFVFVGPDCRKILGPDVGPGFAETPRRFLDHTTLKDARLFGR